MIRSVLKLTTEEIQLIKHKIPNVTVEDKDGKRKDKREMIKEL
jgi:hypothetical protein